MPKYLLKQSDLTQALNACQSLFGLEFDSYVCYLYTTTENGVRQYKLERNQYNYMTTEKSTTYYKISPFSEFDKTEYVTIAIKYSGKIAKTGGDGLFRKHRKWLDLKYIKSKDKEDPKLESGMQVWSYRSDILSGSPSQQVDNIVMFDPQGGTMNYFRAFRENSTAVRFIAFDDYVSAKAANESGTRRMLYVFKPNINGKSGDSFSGEFELEMPIKVYLGLIDSGRYAILGKVEEEEVIIN